jgi:glucose-6-phosphate isomerase
MYATSALCYTRKSAQLSSILTSTQKNILDQITTAIRQAEKNTEYHSQYASIYAPFDIKIKTEIGAQASKVGIIDYLVVIGIGGSSLGFRAVYDALQDQTILKKDQICILETVDTPSVLSALNSIEALLIQQVRVHISVISKSGSTIETLALWYTVQQLLEKYHKNNWNQQVTIITDTGSPLELYAHTHGIKVLTIPQLVGGRYSVFSPAGLFPLALCGLELDTLLQGARDAITALHNTQAVQTTMTIQHAIAIFSAYQRNYQVHDTFIFSTWCKTI